MRYSAIYADPPWTFQTWSERGRGRAAERHYKSTSKLDRIKTMPIEKLAADDCALFLWATWPNLDDARAVIEAWGFTYKTCAFLWVKQTKKANGLHFGLGYWTRANSEPCLLATRGKPKRLHADVPQIIMEPVREHSRKPDCARQRIERLVAGPYVELYARSQCPNWDHWGNETEKFSG